MRGKSWLSFTVAGLFLAACQTQLGPIPTLTPVPDTPLPTTTATLMPSPKPLPTPTLPPVRPNFLLIVTDDQRYDTGGGFMPITQARIFDQGIHFTRGYVTTPLCCPSRASILTGMYAHNHGVRRNPDPLLRPTFVEGLRETGYFTGMVGKYLNSWDGSPRPEYSFWVAFAGGGSRYYNPRLNENGSWVPFQGYITDLLGSFALSFLKKAAEGDRPFFLLFAPNTPHAPADPAPGDEALYLDLLPHRPPNYNEADVSDKPRWLQAMPPLKPEKEAESAQFRRKQLQSLWSLDKAIGAMLEFLEEKGKLNSTVIFYISDNGFLWGEHRLQGKNRVYEPSIRVPFALRYPPLLPAPRVEDHLVANIDIAPTIYQLAGLPIPREVDGLSLVPLIQGRGQWREELLLEGWPGKASYRAIHTSRYVYVETEGDSSELYDLGKDPYQLDNVVADPAYATVVADLRERLRTYKLAGGAS